MAERNTPRRSGMIDYIEAYDVAASTRIEAGHMVALDTSGNAVAYAASADGTAYALKSVVGRCEETVDNSSGAAGDLQVRARIGVFRWDNDGTTAAERLTKAHVGQTVYGEDSETVVVDANIGSGTDGERGAVGRLIAIDDEGAWVATGIPFLQ